MESNEQKNQANKIETDSQDRLTAVRGEELRCWVKNVKGLSKAKQNKTKYLIDTDSSIGITRGKGGWGGQKRVKGDKWSQEEARLWVGNTQQNTEMMYYRIVHLKPA